MRYPGFLPKGGTIGFLAPSFGCNIEPYHSAFLHAVEKLQAFGYRQVFGPNCFVGEGVGISNIPEKCAKEVMDMFLSKETDCLISCGGGELMCEILPFVDFEKLAEAEPKWFMGYSDNTNLTYLLATLADTASVYGPCAAAFGMEPWHDSLYDALAILTGGREIAGRDAGTSSSVLESAGIFGESAAVPEIETAGHAAVVKGYGMWEKESLKNEENPLVPYHLTEPLSIRTFIGKDRTEEPVHFRGRLLGGCLDCLVNLPGTRFDRTEAFVERYKEDGIIWFLEACDLNVFATRRAMWQMEEAGWFRHVKGFLFGRPRNGEIMMNLDAYDAVLEVAGRKGVPVVTDVDLGHLPPMMPLVTGSMADVAVEGNDIRVEMRYV